MEFTKEQNDIIKQNYLTATKEELINLIPGRTWSSIVMRAQKMACGHRPNTKAKNNLKRLLSEELESYYWIGFILSDGHIDNNRKLNVKISVEDKLHLEQFAKYISCNVNIAKENMCYIAARDAENIPLLTKKFDIKKQKTYNPPLIQIFEKMTDDQFICCLAGLIDGDGSIKEERVQIVLACHTSWFNLYQYLEQRLFSSLKYEKFREGWSCKIIKKDSTFGPQELVEIRFSDMTLLRQFREKLIQFNIPIMERKWNRIDLNYISRINIAKSEDEIVLELAKDKKLTLNKLKEKTGFSKRKLENKIQNLRKQGIDIKIKRQEKSLDNPKENRLNIIPLFLIGKRKSEIAIELNLDWFTVRNTIKLWERDIKRVLAGEAPFNPNFTQKEVLDIIREKNLLKGLVEGEKVESK